MKVALLTAAYPPVYNGPGRAAETLARGLARLDSEVTILTLRLAPPTEEERSQLPVRVVRFSTPLVRVGTSGRLSAAARLWFDVRCALWLLRHQGEIDVVQYMTMPTFSFWAIKAAGQILAKPVFARITMYGGDDLATVSKARFGHIRRRWCAELAGVISMTAELDNPSGNTAPENVNVFTLPKYIDTEQFRPLQGAEQVAQLRRTLGIPLSEHVVLFVGSVDFRKGADLAVQSFARVVKEFPSTRLVLVGPVSEAPMDDGRKFSDYLDSLVEEFGLGAAITKTGMQQEVAPWCQIADVFLFPSRNEGMPSALLEAMAAALPTVICRQSWVPAELATDFSVGRVVAPQPASIADAVLWALRNRDAARALGKVAREYVASRHSAEAAAGKLLEVYASAWLRAGSAKRN
jgi:glycosyltransferase involved in cell wall biosynthesis